MISNNKLANLGRGDSGTSFAAREVGRDPSTCSDAREFKVSRVERQCTNDEPRLPKGYRHIRSAVEAVLECAGEHVSG